MTVYVGFCVIETEKPFVGCCAPEHSGNLFRNALTCPKGGRDQP